MENINKATSFTDLLVWKKGHGLVLDIYTSTNEFPTDERFGLTSQIRRAIVSVTSNIAEGFVRKSIKEKQQFYYTSLGSLTEVQNQLLIAKDVGYLPEKDFRKLAATTIEVAKMLNALITSIGQIKT